MRSHNVNQRLSVQRASQSVQLAERDQQNSASRQQSAISAPRVYPNISTERIMQAVEQQRRITQELEDLQNRQQQRAVVLRKTGVRLVIGISLLLGILGGGFVLLSLFWPDILVQLLTRLGDTIALLVAVAEGIRLALSLIPANSWLLSGAALVIVLMTGMWLRLMRYPRKV